MLLLDQHPTVALRLADFPYSAQRVQESFDDMKIRI
jgi:hypothetical protein